MKPGMSPWWVEQHRKACVERLERARYSTQGRYPRKFTDDELRRYMREGHTAPEAAEHFQCCKAIIYEYCKKLNISWIRSRFQNLVLPDEPTHEPVKEAVNPISIKRDLLLEKLVQVYGPH